MTAKINFTDDGTSELIPALETITLAMLMAKSDNPRKVNTYIRKACAEVMKNLKTLPAKKVIQAIYISPMAITVLEKANVTLDALRNGDLEVTVTELTK